MKLKILYVGRRAKDPLVDAADVYLERLGRYGKCELLMLRELGAEGERQAFLDRLGPDEHVVALDERGSELGTVELAERLRAFQRETQKTVTFLIGGADGLHAEVKRRAKETWRLSRLTLPHRLALVLLLEQLYRAHTILRGEPYHRP